MKKIYMILTNGFDPDVRVYKEAKYLVDKGYSVSILCWDRRAEYPRTEIRDNIEIIRFDIVSKFGSGLKQLIPFMKYKKAVKRYLKNKKYDYLHCHDFDGALIGFTINSKSCKKIFDMHEIYLHYSYAKLPFFKVLFNRVIKKFDYIIYVNEMQKNLIDKTQDSKFVFFPNYPEKELYEPIKKSNSSKLRINYIGSLRDYDSLKTLITLGIKDKKFHVKLYGKGVILNKLKDEFNDNEDMFYGAYDGIKDSSKIYQNTDILYCVYDPNVTNWKSAYPVKLYESIITLTPIIVSKGTISADFVKKNNIGEIVEYGNLESLRAAVKNIKDKYNEYVSCLKKIANNYTLEKVIENLDEIYK